MLKKLVIGTAVALAVGTFVFGREAVSYLRTGAASVRQAVKAEVPLEFEIERARTIVGQLIPDIRRCMHVIAEQQVEVETLQQTIARKETELGKQKNQLLSLRSDLSSDRSVFVFAGRSYTKDDVARDISTRFERFKAAEEILSADRKILRAREQNLTANQDKLQGLMGSKKDLEVKLEQLEARLQTIRAAETVSTLAIDDSQLGQAKALIEQLNKQLDIRQKVLDAEGKFTDLIPVETAPAPEAKDLGAAIDAYFQPGPVDAAAAVVQQ